MLTIAVFLLTTGLVLGSVWWACKSEVRIQDMPVSEILLPND